MARGYHPMDDYLAEDWLDTWAREVVSQVEDYLAKHAAFEAFTDYEGPAEV